MTEQDPTTPEGPAPTGGSPAPEAGPPAAPPPAATPPPVGPPPESPAATGWVPSAPPAAPPPAAPPPAAPAPAVPVQPAASGWAASPPPPPPAAAAGWAAPQGEEGPAPGIEFAPHGGRLVAYIIDGLIVGLVVSVILIIGVIVLLGGISIDQSTGQVTSVSGASVGTFLLLFLVSLIIGLLYFPFFWARGGQTPGMRPFGLVVVRDRDGGPIGWGTALLRVVGYWVDSIVFGLPIGFAWVLIDKRRRAWHDLIASTVVIKRS